MSWFRREPEPLLRHEVESRIPEGLWLKCNGCKEIIYRKEILRNLNVCTKCGYHFRISSRERLALLYDGPWQEFDRGLVSADPLSFVDTKAYTRRLKAGRDQTNCLDAMVSSSGSMGGIPTIICAMEYGFIGGSMGVVVGEKVTRAIEKCAQERIPLIVISCSGGARMMEGALSLMQMAKISAALAHLDEVGVPFISLLTDPTTGGVTASFAMLGDLNVAEPGALIGFAGPRVIEQTIRQKLPPGFQRSEFLVDHGMVDMIVDRRDLKTVLVRCLKFFLP
jgi:acetyl-CoA carboxylase carboxyl transferase subunit beta